jgi:hypothetical protein
LMLIDIDWRWLILIDIDWHSLVLIDSGILIDWLTNSLVD